MSNPRFIIVDVVPPHTRIAESKKRVEETISLIHTYTNDQGVISHVIQQRMRPDPTTYIGKGKVEELFNVMKITHELTLGVSLLFKQRCCLPSV